MTAVEPQQMRLPPKRSAWVFIVVATLMAVGGSASLGLALTCGWSR